jgi:hypothetical protein
MKRIAAYFKDKFNFLCDWIKIIFHKESNHKCLIDTIELIESNKKLSVIINYKAIGCRSLQRESAVNLNKSIVFSLFRPDHAQIIVSIATAESLLGISADEVADKFQRYVSYCALKINGVSA